MSIVHGIICVIVAVMVIIDGFSKDNLNKIYWLKVAEMVILLEITGIILIK